MTESSPRADRLQGLLGRLERGESPGALAAEAADDAELLALVTLAGDMARLLPARAPAPFKARLQVDLQERLAARGGKRRRSVPWRWFPRAASTALAVALVLTTAVIASADSLPGQPLYPVKRAVEEVRLALAASAHSRAVVRLDIAEGRAEELLRLIDRGVPIDAGLVEGLIRAHQAAAAEAGIAGDRTLIEAAAEAMRHGVAVALAAVDRVPVADRARAEEMARLWGGVGLPVPEGARAEDTARSIPARDRVSTRTTAPSEPEPSPTPTVRVLAPSTPSATPVPTVPALPPVPESAPSVTRAALSPAPSDTPTATEAPPTDVPSPTPLAELDRATQRAATQAAATHAAATATQRARPPGAPTATPTEPPAQPRPSETPRDPRRPNGLPPAMPDPRSTPTATPSPTRARP